MEKESVSPTEPSEADIVALTIAANRIAGAGGEGNPYEVRNELLNKLRVRRVLYKNGRTLPATAEALQAESERKGRKHSRALGNNLLRASCGKASRPASVDAHHIVAVSDRAALLSRDIIFSVGIGINDASNGVFLPRYRHSVVPSLPNACKHQDGMHSALYHLSVYRYLAFAPERTSPAVRASLDDIASELVNGTFPI